MNILKKIYMYHTSNGDMQVKEKNKRPDWVHPMQLIGKCSPHLVFDIIVVPFFSCLSKDLVILFSD